MLKKLFEKLQKNKDNTKNTKPQYKLDNLYFGEIALLKDREWESIFITNYKYMSLKQFALLEKIEGDKYHHMKSCQNLYDITSGYSHLGDYAIVKPKKFTDHFGLYMRANDLTPKSKLTLLQIIELEDLANESIKNNEDNNINIFE